MLTELQQDSIISELADNPLTVGDTYNSFERAVFALVSSGEEARQPALFSNGERVNARLVDGQYGPVWRLDDAAVSQFGRRFIPFDGSHVGPEDSSVWTRSRSRVQVKLGLVQAWVQGPAQIVKRSSSSNFAVWYTIVRA